MVWWWMEEKERKFKAIKRGFGNEEKLNKKNF
jgi:hypothetical protein